jgi:hypothetical protein
MNQTCPSIERLAAKLNRPHVILNHSMIIWQDDVGYLNVVTVSPDECEMEITQFRLASPQGHKHQTNAKLRRPTSGTPFDTKAFADFIVMLSRSYEHKRKERTPQAEK